MLSYKTKARSLKRSGKRVYGKERENTDTPNRTARKIKKMDNVFEALNERGFIKQTTNAEQVTRLLGEEQVTYYVGFDPTASSLHVGSLGPHHGDGTPATRRA